MAEDEDEQPETVVRVDSDEALVLSDPVSEVVVRRLRVLHATAMSVY
jgi:hypothetical protein